MFEIIIAMQKRSWREFNDPVNLSNFPPVKSDNDRSLWKVRVKIIKSGKAGKTVTAVDGLNLEKEEAKQLLQKLKTVCGTGGTYKNSLFELQGVHLDAVIHFLRKQGYKPKKSGG